MKVLVGFSGGVDSAIAAYLLKQAGHEVTGCFMRNWDSFANNDFLGNPTIDDNICPQEKDYEDAVIAAKIIGIPLLRVDFIKEYWDNVFTYFLAEYQEGRTPNPDILCNKYIKFASFKDFALKEGYDMIAMGHYAKKVFYHGHFYLKKPLDLEKDQTYFLAALTEEQIKVSLFPLDNILKKDVRKLAEELHLNIAKKKDSTGVCFIGERNFRLFLENYLPAKKGDIIDIASGEKIGEHRGVFYYTLGQHRGLGIGGLKDKENQGWYIAKKDVKNNILYVASGDNNQYLYSNKAIIKKMNYIDYDEVQDIKNIKIKFRYRQKDLGGDLKLLNEKTGVVIYQKAKAVTPGQEAVFYSQDDRLIASGVIDEVYFNDERIN